MKSQIVNPYLPLNVCIPDGEPHVFGDRLYVFGSHDEEGGDRFCKLNYEAWSAPVDDLTNWTCHGISYDKANDPDYDENGKYRDMYAPDVVQGNDGRYYLFYSMSGGCFAGPIHVAVADCPEGPYAYHGCVRNSDGSTFWRNITFDPAVINDNGTIRLYYGWAIGAKQFQGIKGFKRFMINRMMPIVERKMFEKTREEQKAEPISIQGAFTVTLADDMLTVTSEPKRIAPGQFDGVGTDFEGHAFFEASSIRKIGDTYYFIYSSEVQHELCYATSKSPDSGFKYRGVLVSNGDIGYQGRAYDDMLAMIGNDHGSIECVNGKWYIFYHRQTHKTSFSRQGCAEEITFHTEDGSFDMAEMTSCGLNGGPLATEGTYNSTIACNLTNGHMAMVQQRKNWPDLPYITNAGEERFIDDINDNTLIGYKYFDFTGDTRLIYRYRNSGQGSMKVLLDDEEVACSTLAETDDWTEEEVTFTADGTRALYFIYSGTGKAAMLDFRFA